MAAKSKKIRTKIKLVSTAKKADGKPTGYYYTTMVNKRTAEGKLKRRKYDPVVRQHVEFVEDKIKS